MATCSQNRVLLRFEFDVPHQIPQSCTQLWPPMKNDPFKENWTDAADFLPQNMTLKVQNWHFIQLIFLWWSKLCTGFDVEREIQVLKGLY